MARAARERVLRRARLRKESGGAAIFIVAVTLALLASMGIYGLSSAANDISAAGHLRQNTQGQHVDEGALMAAAETFNAKTTPQLLIDMKDPAHRANQTTHPCKSAKAPTSDAMYLNAEACLNLTEDQMTVIASKVNTWVSTMYQSTSLGPIPQRPSVHVEITNPVEVPGPAGNSSDGQTQMYFAEVTATVYVDMKNTSVSPASLDAQMLGRGLFTVGPYRK